MAQTAYDLGPQDEAGHDSHFAMHTKHIANIGELAAGGGAFADLGTVSNGTVALARAKTQKVTLSAAATFALPAGTAGDSYQIFIRQNATGGWVATWPAALKWPNAIAGVLSVAAGALDILTITYDGTTYAGVLTKAFG